MIFEAVMLAEPDEVFTPEALAANIGKRYDAGVLIAAEVSPDGRSARITLETDEP